MINNYIKEKLSVNNVNSVESFTNVLREECQKLILYSLGKTDFFNHVAFYGGTCLRIFHNLNRYSEDLDFNVINNNFEIDLDYYSKRCLIDLEAFGFNPQVKTKEQYDMGEMRRRYIVIPIYDITSEYFQRPIVNREQNISIKIEISTNYSSGPQYERKLLNSPLFSPILCFDYPSLFAGKLCAILTRNWQNREKGRDFYDYMFYLSNNIQFNQEYLKSKLSYTLNINTDNLTLEDVKRMLINRFNETNFDMVKKDIMTFVIDNYSLDSINKENFILSVDLLKNTQSMN